MVHKLTRLERKKIIEEVKESGFTGRSALNYAWLLTHRKQVEKAKRYGSQDD